MYAIQRKDLKRYKIPVLLEGGVEDYIFIPFPVKAESVDTDEFYNTKLTLEDGREIFASSIDLEFHDIVMDDKINSVS